MQQLAVTLTSMRSKVRVLEQKQQPTTATPGHAVFATEENCHLGTTRANSAILLHYPHPFLLKSLSMFQQRARHERHSSMRHSVPLRLLRKNAREEFCNTASLSQAPLISPAADTLQQRRWTWDRCVGDVNITAPVSTSRPTLRTLSVP